MAFAVNVQIVWTSVILIYIAAEVCAESCPGTIGSGDTTQFGDNSIVALIVNLEDPAQCSGTVTAYHYCYYYFNGQSQVSVVFMVYRPDGNHYHLVEGSQHVVRRPDFALMTFSCEDEPLDEGQQFEVLKDDVIAACTVDETGDRPLPVHAQDADGHSIYRMDASNCLPPGFSFTTIDHDDLQEEEGFILQLYADIVSVDSTPSPTVDTEPSPSPTDIPPQTSPMAATSMDNTPPATTAIPQASTTALPQTSQMAATSVDDTPPATTAIPQAPTTALPQTSPMAATSTDGMSTAMTTAVPPQTSPEASDSGQSSMPTPTETVMQTSVPHTSPMTATSEESMPTSTSANVPPPAPQSGGGGSDVVPAVVGVCIAVPLLIVICVLIIVVVAMRRSKRKEKQSHNVAAFAMDNAVYDPQVTSSSPGIQLYDAVKFEESQYEVPVASLPTIDYDYYSQSAITGVPVLYNEGHYYSTIGKDSGDIDYSQLLELSHHRDKDIYESLTPYHAPATLEEELYDELKSYGIRHIPKEHIEITCSLGSGQFGKVDKGIWTTPYGAVDVAVKSLSSGGDEVKLLQEAAIMAQFRHPNIVQLHGVVCRGSPHLILIVELAHKGDLRQVLLAMKPGDPAESISEIPKLLLTFSRQIALGMQYLSSKGFIHRDLAARNILVSKDDICKVSDFGMSRDLETGEYYVSSGGKVPVKWTAPEALQYKKYSTASDVWSYSCLLYEIWSLGRKPFTGTTNQEALLKLMGGYRLPPPPGCPRVVYGLMIQCWHPDPSDRPDFRSLLLTLLEDKDSPLSLPEDAQMPHPLAGTLGAPLEAGEGLYPDLQKTYLYSS